MAKIDKEIAAEIVIAYIQAWGENGRNVSMQASDVADAVKEIYSAVASLGKDDD